MGELERIQRRCNDKGWPKPKRKSPRLRGPESTWRRRRGLDIKSKLSAAAVDTTIKKGWSRLRQLLDGDRWHGFQTLAGESDVWVTSFIVTHVSDIAKDAELRRPKSFLATARGASGGWSYGGAVPPDADSTAWCLKALDGSLSHDDRNEAETFLWSHRVQDGIATYTDDSGIREYIQAGDLSIEGWTSEHPDVTAAAIFSDPNYTDRDTILSALIDQQNGSGFYDAYWWRGPHYTTSMVLRAAGACEVRIPAKNAKLLLRGLTREQLEDGGYGLGSSMTLDPLTTAFALESFSFLSYLGAAKERERAARALLEAQRDDGGWDGDYVMRIPSPGVVHPEHVDGWTRGTGGGNSFVLDKDGLFATAASCAALDRWRRVENGELDPGRWPILRIRRKASGLPAEVNVKVA
ncbi:MAG: hypothetical protein DMF63_14330 [Acidobacteria bacterium]|nr:MAG: hypothetical protein DMF63_14330 [Acidobacteriota bacterium]